MTPVQFVTTSRRYPGQAEPARSCQDNQEWKVCSSQKRTAAPLGMQVVEPPYGSQITTTPGGRVVHHADAGKPPPLRGAARLLRRRADLPAGRRADPAEPHQRRRDPGRGGVRPAAARPGPGRKQLPGHRWPRHPPAPGRRAGPWRLAPAAGHHQGRAAAGAPRPCDLDLAGLVGTAGDPATRVIPATSWLLGLLALKLTRTRRVSHVDALLADPTAGLLAGLAVLPKKSALTRATPTGWPTTTSAASWPPWMPS